MTVFHYRESHTILRVKELAESFYVLFIIFKIRIYNIRLVETLLVISESHKIVHISEILKNVLVMNDSRLQVEVEYLN